MAKKKNNESLIKNTFYNTYGTFFYFFCQWLITVLVVRISGYHDAGILSMIISTTNLFFCISLFGMRNYQVSDVESRYSDNHYIFIRLFTIGISFVAFLITLPFFNFENETICCSLIYIIYKFGEALADVLHGSFQRYDSYKEIAISYTLKGLLTVTTFVVTMELTKSLFITLFVNVFVYYVTLVFYDIPKLKQNFSFIIRKFPCRSILKTCFPLMLYTCLVPYLNFVTRYIVESRFGTEILGYYSSVTMVFVIINTLMASVFVTIIPKISIYYIKKDFPKLNKTISILVVIIFLIGIIACIVSTFIGDLVFSLLYGVAILKYMYLLIPTIIASIMLTYVTLFSSILTAFNKNKELLYCNVIAVIICTLTLPYFVDKYMLVGTMYCLIISLSVSAIFLFATIQMVVKKQKTLNLL